MSSQSILARQSKSPLALSRETIRNLSLGSRHAAGQAPSTQDCPSKTTACKTE